MKPTILNFPIPLYFVQFIDNFNFGPLGSSLVLRGKIRVQPLQCKSFSYFSQTSIATSAGVHLSNHFSQDIYEGRQLCIFVGSGASQHLFRHSANNLSYSCEIVVSRSGVIANLRARPPQRRNIDWRGAMIAECISVFSTFAAGACFTRFVSTI